MTEPASTGKKLSPPQEIATVGNEIGTSPCCVSVWNGSQWELWKQSMDEMVKRYSEASKDHGPFIGVSSKVSLFHDHTEDTIFHEGANPFLHLGH